jgi:glucose/arabinose dehydrogenase
MNLRVHRLAGISVLGAAMIVASAGPDARRFEQAAAGQGAQAPRGDQPGRGGRETPPAGRGRRGAIAPPPIVWEAPPLPDGPVTIQTVEPAHRTVRVTITRGLSHPWGMAFLPDGNILITERGGQLRIVRKGVIDPKPIAGVPKVMAQGLSGLLDIALHPRFAENRFVYLTYHKPSGDGQVLALARATWNGASLINVKDIFVTDAASMGDGGTSASRLAFGRDGMIYMSSGNANESPANSPPQRLDHYGGKILRMRDDGGVPPDNPFVSRAGAKPEIFSLGHRTPLAMALNPETGEIWAGEQGPNGGDELNVIRAGRNYGWPIVTQGRNYMGPALTTTMIEGMEPPAVVWIPSIAVSGMMFYTGDVFGSWKRNVFVGGLRQGETPRTGQLQRIVFNENWQELRREALLRDLHQRIRDVRQGPDGLIYVLTDEDNAALLRLEPAS